MTAHQIAETGHRSYVRTLSNRVTLAVHALSRTLGLLLLLACVPAWAATAPDAPTIGTATGGNAQATVTFAAPASNGGSAITGYTVTSLPAGGVDSNAGTTGLSHIITGLVNGTAYTFTVKATNAAGTSAASAPSNSVTPVNMAPMVSITTPTNNAIINAPTNGVIATVAVGNQPLYDAVNPVTNKIYVANNGSGTVTVIDGATNTTSAVNAGLGTHHIAVNPITNKIYATNTGGNTVTVIDGVTNTTSTVVAGISPWGVAVNTNTNKIYVTNAASNNVTVIDGVTNTTTTVAVGPTPYGIAVNQTTNKIYVPNRDSNTVTVIDGATNTTTTIIVGGSPWAVAVNETTNKIYVANNGSGSVTVINGTTNTTTTVAAGVGPFAVAVNPVTNKIYVANNGGNTVTVIDGATNTTSTVVSGTSPYTIAVNPTTNKIYVANNGSNTVTVIDGATNTTSSVPAGIVQIGVAVNPVTNKIYVANNGSNTATVIGGGGITLSANAADADGTISKVEFYSGTTLLGTVTTAPYNYGWSNMAAGSYVLTAKAYDNQGAVTTSAAVAITVLATVPGAPTIGIATGGNLQATVTFTAPASNGGSAITGYTVTSLPAGGVDSNAGTTGLSHVITGLTNGTAYTFTVKATNAVGTSAASAASNSVKPATVPGAPSIGTATGGNLQATVTFTAPASNGGSAITGYTVTSLPAGGVDSNAGTTGLSHIITGLTNGTAYTFTVKATNAAGTGAASASSNSVTPAPTAPGAPTNVAAVRGNAQATVTFTAPANNGGSAITGYTVTSLPAGGVDSNAGTTGLSHVITGLTNGTAYTFTVTATNALGTGAASAASNSVTPATVPGAPTIGAATGGNAQATVTFAAPASNGGSAITGYTVTSLPAGGVDSNAGTTGLSHIITGLTNGTAYTFTVKATNAAGTGAASASSNSVTPAPTAPGAPTNVAAVRGNAQATVTFTAPANNGGSAITGYTVTSLPAGGVDSNAGTTGLSHIITGLANGTAYTFTVKATNAVGTSAASAASNSVTPVNLSPTVSMTAPANNAIIAWKVDSVIATVTAGSGPSVVAVNSITNMIYVLNSFSNNVTVINGITNSTTTVAVGSQPRSIAVNPVSNKIYVTNWGAASVTVIDGATNGTTTVAAGTYPTDIAINSTTNKVYVVNGNSNTVTVIDGVTNATTTVATGLYPIGIAVNSTTNKIYVSNYTGNTVTVITGATNATTTVTTGINPGRIAINSTTNKVYVITGNGITVIDGATNGTTTVAAGNLFGAIAINLTTNKIYVANKNYANNGDAIVMVVDGATNNTANIAVGSINMAISSGEIAVNPTTNKIYMSSYGGGYGSSVVVIDGVTTNFTIFATGNGSGSIAVNPATDKIYVSNINGNNVTVMDGGTVTLSANAADTDGTISKVEYYGNGVLLGTVTTAPYSYSWENMASGTYALTAKAYDNQNAVTTSAAIIITITVPPTVSIISPANNSTFIGQASITLTAIAADSDGTISKVEFYDYITLLGTVTTAPYSYIWNTPAGVLHHLTARATDNLGVVTSSAEVTVTTYATVPGAPTAVTATGSNAKAIVSFTAPASNGGSAITSYTATSSPGGITGTCAVSPCTVTGLTNLTAYTFTVKATNAIGNSAASVASANVTPMPIVPDAPLIGTATSANAKAIVNFTAPTSDGGSAITSYTATSNTGGIIGTCTTSPCTVTGLTNNVSYSFKVTATNAVGTGAASAASNLVTPAPTVPGVPTNVVAAGGNTLATVTFAAPDNGGLAITRYTVTSSPGSYTATCTVSPCTVTGLTNGMSYYFTVTATNALGTSAVSAASNSVIPDTIQAYYIHTDQLDTPRAITDTAGNKVWEWQNSDPFGNNMANENPAGLGAFNFNLRFPGQYYDRETNLHYNVNRDYDPNIGRYIQSDPIGLGGGINTYTYVGGNPLLGIDPLGLWDMYYGCWTGANWSGCHSGPDIPANPQKPVDAVDACAMQHDYCYAEATSSSSSCSIKEPPTISSCDTQLAQCTVNIDYSTINSLMGKFIGPYVTWWAAIHARISR